MEAVDMILGKISQYSQNCDEEAGSSFESEKQSKQIVKKYSVVFATIE